MRFLSLTTALLAPFCVQASVEFTNSQFGALNAGEPFKLTWKGDGTPVTITLMDGPSANLAKVSTVAASAIESSYIWTPPSDTKSGTYALQIAQSGSTNYSPQFTIKGSSTSSSSSSSAASNPSGSTTSGSATATSQPSPTHVMAAVQQPPYPAGPNNSSNATIASAATTSDIVLSSSIPAAAGTPVATVYTGNGTISNGTGTDTFAGGVVRIRKTGWVVVGWTALVGSLVVGLGLVC